MADFNWDALAEITQSRDARPPAPAFTAYDYMEKYAVGRPTADNKLRKMIDAGQLRSGKFWNHERRRWTSYYWLPS